jgi:hypothetical protein
MKLYMKYATFAREAANLPDQIFAGNVREPTKDPNPEKTLKTAYLKNGMEEERMI